MYNSTESTPCQTTTSNSLGEFTFNNLLDDSYYIEIDSPGYLYYKTEPIQKKSLRPQIARPQIAGFYEKTLNKFVFLYYNN